MRLTFFALAIILTSAGCRGKQPEPDPLGYVLVIPEDIPGEIELIDKDGTRHQGNGCELYADGHKTGWRCCWEEFQKGRVKANDPDAWKNYVPQDYIVAARGFTDGFKQRMAILPK